MSFISERRANAFGIEAINSGRAKRYRVRKVYIRNPDRSVDLSYQVQLFV